MTSIVAWGAVAVSLIFVVYFVFLVLARGVRGSDDYEVEVKLFPPTFRLKVERNDRHHLGSEAVHISISDHPSHEPRGQTSRAERTRSAAPPKRREQTKAGEQQGGSTTGR